jgi:hypothetical protein
LKGFVGNAPPEEAAFTLELADFECQFADHGTAELTDDPDEEPLPEGADELDVDGGDSLVRGPAITEVIDVQIPISEAPSHYLAHLARDGLSRILTQFRVSPEEKKQIANLQ